MPEDSADNGFISPRNARLVWLGMPMLAGALVAGLGCAYFLQKDTYLKAAHRNSARLEASYTAQQIAARLTETKSASGALAGMLASAGGGQMPTQAVESLLASAPAVASLAVVGADGNPLAVFDRRHLGTSPALRVPAPSLTAIGSPQLSVAEGEIRFAQTLHGPNGYFGDAVANTSPSEIQRGLAPLLAVNLDASLEKLDPGKGSMDKASNQGQLEEPILIAGAPSALILRASPREGWQGNPFLLIELALCLIGGLLSTAFGILVLRPRNDARGSEGAAVRASALGWLETALDASPSPGCVQDEKGRYLIVNSAFERFTGHDRQTLRQWGEVAAQANDLFDLLTRDPLPSSAEVIGADGRRHAMVPKRVSFPDAVLRGLRLTMFADRTEHQEAARRVAEVSRSFAVFSGINQAIVRMSDEASLLERCCELLVERGEFPLALAWRQGEAGLELIASRGETPDHAARILQGLPSCPANCAAFSGRILLCVDSQCRNQSLFESLTDIGIHSLALIPLHDRRVGFALASREKHVFSADEAELLRELSETLGHALSSLSLEKVRRQAEERLRLSARVFENSSEGIIIADADNRILMVNRTFSQVTGYSAAEVIGRNPRLLSSGQQSPEFYRDMWASIQRRGEWHGEVQNRRKNGEYYSEWLTISVVKNESGEITNYVAVFSDITSKKQIAERLNFLANYDPLTTLPNRVLFADRIEQAVSAARPARKHVAVLALDLDRFSLINETFGHAAGDLLLKEIAKRLTASVREGDSVSRVGGDEFSIVLADLESPDEATTVAGKIMQAMALPLLHDGKEIFASASIGIGVFPDDGDDADALVKNANSAMYRAMEEGRNTFRFYHQEMNARSSERMSLHSELRRALERGELEMHYQPFIDSRDGRIVGAEALLRWHRPEIGFVTPAAFIPLLEETGLIVPVGEWVLRTAVEDCRRWQTEGHDLFVAVNFSALQLTDQRVTRYVADTLASVSANPRHLEIELTESAVMRDPDRGIQILSAFREIGTRLSIDDFGTGYSSLAYLKKLPIDTLKIDRSFVIDTPGENEANAIVQAIVAMGHNLELNIIAEGVQEQAQVDFLRQIRCDLLQGFHFSSALPHAEFLRLVAAGIRGETPWLAKSWAEMPTRRLSRVG